MGTGKGKGTGSGKGKGAGGQKRSFSESVSESLEEMKEQIEELRQVAASTTASAASTGEALQEAVIQMPARSQQQQQSIVQRRGRTAVVSEDMVDKMEKAFLEVATGMTECIKDMSLASGNLAKQDANLRKLIGFVQVLKSKCR